MYLTHVVFLTCNPGPAEQFAALGQSLDPDKYKVHYVGSGAGLGKFKSLSSSSISEAEAEAKISKILKGIGYQSNWADNFDKALQKMLKG